jgi:hypothetical protein
MFQFVSKYVRVVISLVVSRYGSDGDAVEPADVPSPAGIPTSRRPSFRAIIPSGLYDTESPDQSGKPYCVVLTEREVLENVFCDTHF